MKAERLFRTLGLVDPALVEEAMEAPGKRAIAWKRWGAMAACLALVIGIGWLANGGPGGSGGGMSGSSGGDGFTGSAAPGEVSGDSEEVGGGSGGVNGLPPPGASESGENEGMEASFLWYQGPVFPLTTAEDSAGLTAERETTWALNREELKREYTAEQEPGTAVTDAYTLRNETGEDVTVTALYPAAGPLGDLGGLTPSVTVDGAAVETAAYPGPVSSGYENAAGINKPYFTADLSALDSWEAYKVLLESGLYQEWALADTPELDMPVTVYEFSDFEAPLEEYPAATQAVSFRVDGEKSRIFTYGIQGVTRDGDLRRYSFFVPGADTPPRLTLKLLIVLGEDIGDYTLEGFRDGGYNPREKIGGVSCSVTRRTTTLDAVLDQICRHAYDYDLSENNVGRKDGVPLAMFRDEFVKLLVQYSFTPGATRDLCSDGRLDDMVWECWGRDRVFYTAFSVTVPAGGSAEVRCALWKRPSSDPWCARTEHVGLQGYDLVTRAGSALEFTAQRAALGNTEGIELAAQNFGFDLENGVSSVELDLSQEHYYMAVRVT